MHRQCRLHSLCGVGSLCAVLQLLLITVMDTYASAQRSD